MAVGRSLDLQPLERLNPLNFHKISVWRHRIHHGRRAAIETFGLVHEHKKGMPFTSHVRWQNLVKKAALRTVGGGAHYDGRDACRPRGGRQFWCCRVADPHHDRRGEVLSSVASFPWTFPAMCPNVNRQPPLWAKLERRDSGGGAIPVFPRLPRALRA